MKKPSIPTLRRKLDRVFSVFIRKRGTNMDGYGPCVTCGTWMHWSAANAGHWIKRQHLATRYDERNVNFQCVQCNLWKHGNLIEYTFYMQKKYGHSVVIELMRLKRTTVKLTRADYEAMIARFSQGGK